MDEIARGKRPASREFRVGALFIKELRAKIA
jgi:hypothetical protein